jgi:hypothetical protein
VALTNPPVWATLEASPKGGAVIAGGLNPWGGIDPAPNPVNVVALAAEKGSQTLFLPGSSWGRLNDFGNSVATKIALDYRRSVLPAR